MVWTRHTLDSEAGADLELPLGGKDLSVDAGNVDAGEDAGAVVGLDDITAVDFAGTNTTVVGALGTRETTLGPSVRRSKLVKQGVLLLKTEPGLHVLVGLHELCALVAVVELVGGSIGVPALGENEDVVTATERVGEDGDGAEVDVRVTAGGLVGGRAVEVPLGKLVDGGGLLEEGLGG